jgi:Caulimovirus viroplasmin
MARKAGRDGTTDSKRKLEAPKGGVKKAGAKAKAVTGEKSSKKERIKTAKTRRKAKSSPTTYWAVKVGRIPGVYTTAERCQDQVRGFSGAVAKRFTSKKLAEAFVGEAAKQQQQVCAHLHVHALYELQAPPI